MTAPGLFFVHVMKTAGTALGRLWRAEFPSDETYPDVVAREGPAAKVLPENLLGLPPERRQRTRFYTVHMPAWTADRAPGFIRATVLREPIERTISHLRHLARMPDTPDDLTELYEDPEWHARLVDYQTQLFSDDSAAYLQLRRRKADVMRDAAEHSEAERAHVALVVNRIFTTGVEQPRPVDDDALARAIHRLETFDVVGTTEHLDRFVADVSQRMGWSATTVPVVNSANERGPVPAALLARIEADTRHDALLWAHARTLA